MSQTARTVGLRGYLHAARGYAPTSIAQEIVLFLGLSGTLRRQAILVANKE
jgi:hypothetical protein